MMKIMKVPVTIPVTSINSIAKGPIVGCLTDNSGIISHNATYRNSPPEMVNSQEAIFEMRPSSNPTNMPIRPVIEDIAFNTIAFSSGMPAFIITAKSPVKCNFKSITKLECGSNPIDTLQKCFCVENILFSVRPGDVK